jgi:Phosphotransferase enzyme family
VPPDDLAPLRERWKALGAEDGPEVRLPGGNLHGAVRTGATVRKPAGPWTVGVDRLLVHLETSGFQRAPRSLGVDDHDRHVLSYLEGETVGDGSIEPWPTWCWRPETLLDAARWLRDYHDAVRSFDPGPVDWRYRRAMRPGWVICHNDVAPYNTVRREGSIALIDWDIAGPGDPMWDVAQAAWQFAPLHHPALTTALGASVVDAPRRARRFLDTYGVDDPEPFVDAIGARVRASIEGIEQIARTDPAFARLGAAHLPDLRTTVGFLDDRREELAAAFRRDR